MARIRTIKPEFFTSEDIVALTPLARLFYVSLWCEADREGRLSWRKGTLKQRYLPADDCSIDLLANELEAAGLIVIYEVDGKLYAEIPSFKTHQVINNRESESAIPPRVKVACTRVQGEGKEGKEGKERKEGKDASSTPDGVSDLVWQAFLKIRKAKRAPITEIAIAGIRREAAQAGITLEEALTECVTRGWQSFKADWYTKPVEQSQSFKGMI